MELLKKKYEHVSQALKTLNRAIEKYEDRQAYKERNPNDPDIEETLQDSMIQRFEYSFDSFWKYLKNYLEHIIQHIPSYYTLMRTILDKVKPDEQ